MLRNYRRIQCVDNYRASGYTVTIAAAFHKAPKRVHDDFLHARRVFPLLYFFFRSVLARRTKPKWVHSSLTGSRIYVLVAGRSALFAVLSWHFESVSDFIDYPWKRIFPRWTICNHSSPGTRASHAAFDYDRESPLHFSRSDGFPVYLNKYNSLRVNVGVTFGLAGVHQSS